MNIPGLDGIKDKPYFHGLIPREDIAGLLKREGDYLFRITEPAKGDPQSIVISVLADEKVKKFKGLKHYVILSENDKFHIGNGDMHDSIRELIKAHKEELRLYNGVGRESWELEHSDVHIGSKLGKGAYGEVCKGTVGDKPVAIKQNHMGNLAKAQIKEVMAEARNMRRLNHPNIVKLVGIAALEEPLLIVMELASNGSLDTYLKKTDINCLDKSIMCQEIAWALRFLKTRRILHRDLAARNCLYDNGVVKLSDFGKSQPGPMFKMDTKERLPIRWLPPESLSRFEYNYESEVWSFGICCWEIFENGAEPYPGKTNREIRDDLVTGQNFPRHSLSTPYLVRNLMNDHVLVVSSARTTIEEVDGVLEKITKRQRPKCSSDKSSEGSTDSKCSMRSTDSKSSEKRRRRKKTRNDSCIKERA